MFWGHLTKTTVTLLFASADLSEIWRFGCQWMARY